MGAALAVAILLPVGAASSGGFGAYPAFVANTLKHQATPLTNNMGLRTVVAYRPSEVARLTRNDQLFDSFSRWKEARLKNFREAKPLYFSIVLCYLVLLGLAVRRAKPWEAIALSTTFIAFGVELTNYYYSFIIVVALLYAKREVVGRWLLAATAFTQLIAWAPIRKLPSWFPAAVRNLGMPTELDEQCTLMSVAILVVFAMIAWDMMVASQATLAPQRVPASQVGTDRRQSPASDQHECGSILSEVLNLPRRTRQDRSRPPRSGALA
jgi:hypothetical protein